MKEEIRKALEEATPEPWEKLHPKSVIGHVGRAVVQEKESFDWICSMQVSNCPNWEADAHLIANAPTWLKWQNDRIEQLEQAIKEIMFAYENELTNERAAKAMYEIANAI